jgi:signal transduction histidine kinase
MSIKAKQVAGVTTLVAVIVAALSAYNLAALARLSLSETATRGDILAKAIFQRARDIVPQGGANPYETIRNDSAIRRMIESFAADERRVTYVAITDTDGIAVAHLFPSLEGERMEERENLNTLVKAGPYEQLSAVYASDRPIEVVVPMLAGDTPFGSVRIGMNVALVRAELKPALAAAGGTLLAAILISTVVAMLLAQWMLRPIHVIQSGLTRLGRGELDVRLDLPEQEFRDLGSSFQAVSAQLSAIGRAGPPAAIPQSGTGTDLESVMDNLEDAVALFSPSGELIFCNKAMDVLFSGMHSGRPGDNGGLLALLPDGHPVRQMVERTLAGRKPQGPVSITLPAAAGASEADEPERLVMSHSIEDMNGRFLGAMLVARNLSYLSHIQTSLHYSHKLAALGRLMAGVAHEVKNPLNAMTIHLELLKQKLARQPVAAAVSAGPPITGTAAAPDVEKHVNVIANEIRRLDEVLIGFLKFARPDELKLQPMKLASLISDVASASAPEADTRGIVMRTECDDGLHINADPGMLRQALLNLAINACQAMPNGGTLRISGQAAARHRVQIDVEDTGVGIPPEHLGRIFDLYFTTKEKGSGIGLSMVYRIVQLHDGEVEVQSTPGRGTTFSLSFPQA